jgi:hypothetical protein
MPVEITYRTDGAWGSGIGVDLTAAQVDTNFSAIQVAIAALETDRPTPNEIVSTTQHGISFSFNLQNGDVLGPIDLPVISFHFFDAWEPFTLYSELDSFVVDGNGIYTTLLAHTTGATFNAALLVSGEPAYRKLFGFAPDGGSSVVYDLEFQYQGVLSDALAPPVSFLALRAFTLPSSAAGEYLAYLVEAPSTAQQVLPILHGASQIGTLTFDIGVNTGTTSIAVAEDFAFGDRLVLGIPGAADATAAGLTWAVPARRII